jgi:predicted nucleic acid binding AN1-type Zn finger protein
MIDLLNDACEYDECSKQPIFNVKGEKKGRFCLEHALPEMVDVKNKMCEYDDCSKRAHFDIPGGKGRFCSEHKNDTMLNSKQYI